MRSFTIVTYPFGTFAVVDDSALAEPEVYAEKDNGDRHGERLRALVEQANAAVALAAEVEELKRDIYDLNESLHDAAARTP